MSSPLETAQTEHRRVQLHTRRAREARHKRDTAVREAMANGVGARTIGRLLGFSEAAARKIAKEGTP